MGVLDLFKKKRKENKKELDVPAAPPTADELPTFPVSGDIWFDTNATPSAVNVWDGSSWLLVGSDFWSLTGNLGTDATTDFIGRFDK